MSARIHKHLSVDLWCIVLQHQRSINQADCLKTKRERAPESKELKINLAELDIEFSEISDVIEENSLTEVTLDELVL